MFPYKDDNPTLRTPVVTYAIIAANVLMWLLVQGAGTDPALTRSVCELGLKPGELLQTVPPGTAVELAPGVVCVMGRGPAWHTVLSSMFMHGGWAHILGNLWFLWIFGNNVEDAMGRLRFATFYVLCGLGAAATQVLVDVDSVVPMVGASGAISGVMGAYIALYPRVRVHVLVVLGIFITTITVPAFLMLGFWILLQVLGGLPQLSTEAAGVAFWAHVGGFVCGVALVWPFKNAELVEMHRRMVGYPTTFRRFH